MLHWGLNVLIGLNQLVNAILGGKPDETISSRTGRAAEAGHPVAVVAEKIINALFFWDADHCRKRIEWEEL